MKNRNLNESFSHAFNGIIQAFKTENNIKRHTLAAVLAVLAGVLLEVSTMEWVITILLIGFVVVSEMLCNVLKA